MLAYMAIRRYMAKGHEMAKLDPLNLKEIYGDTREFGKKVNSTNIVDSMPFMNAKQLDTPFHLENGEYLKEVSFFLREKSIWTLREILEKLD